MVQPQFLHDLPRAHADCAPDSWALLGEKRLSYAELAKQVDALARYLAQQYAPGARVGVLAWNSNDYLILIYACSAAGLVLVPLNTRLAMAEWQYQLQSTRPSLLVYGPEFKHQSLNLAADVKAESALIETLMKQTVTASDYPLPAIAPDSVVWVLHTSGSTGKPKGAMLTHQSFLAGLESAAQGRPVLDTDVYLYPFPLFHVSAHNVFLQHRHGAAVWLLPGFDADRVLSLCEQGLVSTLSLAPTMIAMLLDHPNYSPAKLTGVRAIGYGASAMPLPLMQMLLSTLDIELSQSYGMTELSGSISFLMPDDHREGLTDASIMRSVGRPVKGVEVTIRNDQGDVLPSGAVGEVCVAADQCMRGYWERPQDTERAIGDGYLRTGDLGLFDDRGYLTLVDRKKDMIISGGENVASREVEDILSAHNAVKQVAVVGLPHERWGEVVCACLVLSQAIEAEELDVFCRAQLAAFKCPRRYVTLESLPLNASGKIDKPALRQALLDQSLS
jgi:acyl-CoA synthetase (AMP-forming)/AMP-acid ligase II